MVARVPHLVSVEEQSAGAMTIKIHDLKPAAGSNRRKKRVGRGIAGKGGKTAGRGTKGQKARSNVPASFEGGQMPLHMRLPKLKGFNNPFRVEYQGINLDTIEESGLDEISPATLQGKGLAHKGALIKVLGRGELTRKVTVSGARLLQVRRGSHHRRRRYGGDPAQALGRPPSPGAGQPVRQPLTEIVRCRWQRR